VSGKQVVVALLTAIVTAICVVRFWPGDERAIRKQLAVIEEAGSKQSTEQPVEGLLKTTQLATLFSDPCRLTVTDAGHADVYPRKQIRDRIIMVRALYTQVQVSLHDITIAFAENNTAVVRGTIRLRGQGTGEAIADVQELRAEMGKIDGKWLLTAVEIVEVLEQ
jgi:hypothetical protein